MQGQPAAGPERGPGGPCRAVGSRMAAQEGPRLARGPTGSRPRELRVSATCWPSGPGGSAELMLTPVSHFRCVWAAGAARGRHRATVLEPATLRPGTCERGPVHCHAMEAIYQPPKVCQSLVWPHSLHGPAVRATILSTRSKSGRSPRWPRTHIQGHRASMPEPSRLRPAPPPIPTQLPFTLLSPLNRRATAVNISVLRSLQGHAPSVRYLRLATVSPLHDEKEKCSSPPAVSLHNMPFEAEANRTGFQCENET